MDGGGEQRGCPGWGEKPLPVPSASCSTHGWCERGVRPRRHQVRSCTHLRRFFTSISMEVHPPMSSLSRAGGGTWGSSLLLRLQRASMTTRKGSSSLTHGMQILDLEVRKVGMLDGVTILRSKKVKDEIVLDGNDIELVSPFAALIN